MIARLAVAKRVVLLKRIVDTLPLFPVVAAALGCIGPAVPGPAIGKAGRCPTGCAGSAPISGTDHASQTANTSFGTIPRGMLVIQRSVWSQTYGRPTDEASPSMTTR